MWGLAVMRRAFVAAWSAQAALRPAPACPACRAPRYQRAGTKTRHLEARFGPVVVARQRLRCRGCGHYYQPDDAVVAPVLARGRCTPALCRLAPHCAER